MTLEALSDVAKLLPPSGPLRHAVRVAHNVIREAAKRGNWFARMLLGMSKRSPKWREVERHFLAIYPRCAACDSTVQLSVHHVKPVLLCPELELAAGDPAPPDCNLIVLCMGPNECHLRLGHGSDFLAYNPRVRQDSYEISNTPRVRPAVEMSARIHRLYSMPLSTSPRN